MHELCDVIKINLLSKTLRGLQNHEEMAQRTIVQSKTNIENKWIAWQLSFESPEHVLIGKTTSENWCEEIFPRNPYQFGLKKNGPRLGKCAV